MDAVKWQKVPWKNDVKDVKVHSNVKDGQIFLHILPVNEERQKAWIHAVSKRREDFLRNQNILKQLASYVQIISLREGQLNVIQIQHYF